MVIGCIPLAHGVLWFYSRKIHLGFTAKNTSTLFKDGVYYCYCAYVLRISRYSDFLLLVLINTGIFLRGSKLCGESRTFYKYC